MVEVTEFPHLAQKYSVTAVPKMVLNDRIELTGLQPEDVLIENILLAAKP